MINKSEDPIKASKMAGIPNRITTFLLNCLPTSNNLNILLLKWTIPVRPTATSIGKKKTKTGVSKVPKPNPEKNVRIDAEKATIDIKNTSNINYFRSIFS